MSGPDSQGSGSLFAAEPFRCRCGAEVTSRKCDFCGWSPTSDCAHGGNHALIAGTRRCIKCGKAVPSDRSLDVVVRSVLAGLRKWNERLEDRRHMVNEDDKERGSGETAAPADEAHGLIPQRPRLATDSPQYEPSAQEWNDAHA